MKDLYITIGEVIGENADGTLDVRLYPTGHSGLDLTKGGRFLTVHTINPVFNRGEYIG